MIFIGWLVVLVYLIPIVGTVVSWGRKIRSLWSIGGDVRNLIPPNPISRTLKRWSMAIRAWWRSQDLSKRWKVKEINVVLGSLEYLIGHLRDYTIGVVMTGGAVYNLTMSLLVKPQHVTSYFYDAFYFGVFALLSLFTYRRHVTTGLKMTEFMRVNPWVHPSEFFKHYYRAIGPLNVPVPERATEVVDPEDVSYCTGKAAETGKGRLLYGFYDTSIFARSAYKAMTSMGPVYGYEVFDVMASLWGSRIIQLFRSSMKVEGIEKFNQIEGKVLLVFNHKSHLDFVLNFFALSQVQLKNGQPLRPRYMAAKDHFVDNKIIYEGLGVGKLIESVDMVFVDRTGKGADAIQQAAEVLTKKDVSIAMFPQGTRAYGNLGEKRERRDAGYYTTGSARRLRERLGHLKKGCAFLALDTAIELNQQGRDDAVNLVFIGIDGTADLVPKGAFSVRTESAVTFTVGDVLTIKPHEVAGYKKPSDDAPLGEGEQKYKAHVDRLMEMINSGLVGALSLHQKLSDRFIADVRERKLLQADDWMKLKNRLVSWDQAANLLPFQIIDRIYALDPSYWQTYLEKAAQLFKAETIDEAALSDFNGEIVDYLLKTRGKLMKRANMSEEKRNKKKLKQAS